MKEVEGHKYLTFGEVGKLIGRSSQTLKLWYQYADAGNETCLPKLRRDLDSKGTRYVDLEDIDKIFLFRNTITRGQLSEVTIQKWGRQLINSGK